MTRAINEAADLIDWMTTPQATASRLYARTASFCSGSSNNFDSWDQGRFARAQAAAAAAAAAAAVAAAAAATVLPRSCCARSHHIFRARSSPFIPRAQESPSSCPT
jgi:hypothetical protein